MEPGSVLESAEFIASRSKHVSIVETAVESVAQEVRSAINTLSVCIHRVIQLYKAREQGAFDLSNWKRSELNPKTMDEDAINWIFVVDTLNFSFFPDDDSKPFQVEYQGKIWSGYWSLCAAINKALSQGIPITTASFFKDITLEDVKKIFTSVDGVEVPLLAERHRVLQEAGQILCQKFDGSFVNCIRQCNKSAKKLLQLIVENFPSYRDECQFEGRTVRFYKRAQILVSDIWACFEGKSYGEFVDIDHLTMFADYRVPQCLVYFGVLKYSSELQKLLEERKPIPSGDPLECEIRGCSIWVVELIRRAMARQQETDALLNSVVIDFYLWEYAKRHSKEMASIPIHRTRSIFY